ncbi:MAG TPA: hypothetical protein VFV41_21770 [Streptosporangiaceae bacterium]|nr:hypothetical protein [Streptosporangiaceae bacterium]
MSADRFDTTSATRRGGRSATWRGIFVCCGPPVTAMVRGPGACSWPPPNQPRGSHHGRCVSEPDDPAANRCGVGPAWPAVPPGSIPAATSTPAVTIATSGIHAYWRALPST